MYELLKDFLTKFAYFLHEIVFSILWRNFSGVLFDYLIKKDIQNVLLQLARNPWGTGINFWSRVAVSTLDRSHKLVFIDPGVKIIGYYNYRDVLLAQHLLPVIRNLALEGSSTFQQDSESAHRARSTIEMPCIGLKSPMQGAWSL